ncbi:hypothetical protein LJY25_03390 [Hymenobacter sp. BT175]|uniref:hypothetical protein n=1 Tax=Hymenobacter translucens TaxID=2886507 RepID=UPI001D0E14ED|nr:hypothetical protein [Hymenobacter translucens]MCC2545474.1 hypothetical protein [Hymenobacter translucens]
MGKNLLSYKYQKKLFKAYSDIRFYDETTVNEALSYPTVRLVQAYRDYIGEVRQNLLNLSGKGKKYYLRTLLSFFDEYDYAVDLAELTNTDEAEAERIGRELYNQFQDLLAASPTGQLTTNLPVVAIDIIVCYVVRNSWKVSRYATQKLLDELTPEKEEQVTVPSTTLPAPLLWEGNITNLLELFVELDRKGYIRLPSPDQPYSATWEVTCRAICGLFDLSAARRVDSKGEPWATLETYFKDKTEDRRTQETTYNKITEGKAKFDSIRPNDKKRKGPK